MTRRKDTSGMKMTEKSPDMGGKVTLNGKVYKLGCWARESESGTPYTSLGFKPEENDASYDNSNSMSDRTKAAF